MRETRRQQGRRDVSWVYEYKACLKFQYLIFSFYLGLFHHIQDIQLELFHIYIVLIVHSF